MCFFKRNCLFRWTRAGLLRWFEWVVNALMFLLHFFPLFCWLQTWRSPENECSRNNSCSDACCNKNSIAFHCLLICLLKCECQSDLQLIFTSSPVDERCLKHNFRLVLRLARYFSSYFPLSTRLMEQCVWVWRARTTITITSLAKETAHRSRAVKTNERVRSMGIVIAFNALKITCNLVIFVINSCIHFNFT